MSPHIIVYVAGPFSAKTRAEVDAHIERAVAVGLEVAKLGACPLIPHANTAHPAFEAAQPYEFWIWATLELLKRSDALIMVHGWEQSSGARAENNWARANGMPVFYGVDDLWEALQKGTILQRTSFIEGQKAALRDLKGRVEYQLHLLGMTRDERAAHAGIGGGE